MTHQILDLVQGSQEWLAARAGLITASMASIAVSTASLLDAKQLLYANAILSGQSEEAARAAAGYKAKPTSTGIQRVLDGESATSPSAASDIYRDVLAFERISEEPYGDTFETHAMKRGREQEWLARAWYEDHYKVEIVESGLAISPDGKIGYSTDGKIFGQRGGIEIKTPESPSKLRELVESFNVSEYEHQIHTGMLVCDWDFIDNVIWMPHLRKVGNEAMVVRVHRNEAFIDKLAKDLYAFEARVQEAVAFWSKPMRRDGLADDVTARDVPPPIAAPLALPPAAAPDADIARLLSL